MNALVTRRMGTPLGDRALAVCVQDIAALDSPLDVMVISAFRGDYHPLAGTLIGSLDACGISVAELAENPEVDLRETSGLWLSRPIGPGRLPIGRIGCVELTEVGEACEGQALEERILASIQSLFHMLHIASLSGIGVCRIGLPVLGAGNQGIDADLLVIPMLRECRRFLTGCQEAREIRIVTKDQAQAFQFALALSRSGLVSHEDGAAPATSQEPHTRPLVFISHSSRDKFVTADLCAKLEAAGIDVWYAPRDIQSTDYAAAIVGAISRCTHFVVLSASSLASQHVLNEIDLAFQELGRGCKIMPLRIDEEELGPSFRYYLSRQHWMDAFVPPLARRLHEFVSRVRSAE